MPNPPLTRPLMEQSITALQNALDAGYRYLGVPSAFEAAAKSMNVNQGTFRNRIKKSMAAGFTVTIPDLAAPPPIVERTDKPRIRVKAQSGTEAPIYRVLGIGDAHDQPGLPDKSRFKWLAKLAAEMQPDYVVQIGDFASFDSLSRHEQPGSLPQKLRPSYNADMESLEAALRAFFHYADGLNLHVTLGNHEARVLRYERGTAEIEGTLWQPVLDLFARYGWKTHDEGQFLFVGGVGFVHAPRTLMGREYGGKTLNAIANDAMFSIVFGHNHRGQILHAPKIGPQGGVTICNLGTCLPTGYIADYAKVATHSWTYGCYQLTVQAGKIIGHSFISMDELKDRFE